jgi:carboxyl-terminal processing protease
MNVKQNKNAVLAQKHGTHRVIVVFVVGFFAFLIGLGVGIRGTTAGAFAQRRSMVTATASVSASSTDESFIGRVLGLGDAPPADTANDIDFNLFWNVWTDLKKNYYEQPIEDKKLLYGAIQGMTDAVGDPYTMYFPPSQAKAFADSMKGEFSGIGAEIGMKNGELQVIAPLPDSPAEKAGIQSRDFILKINDEDSIAMPVEEAVSKIRGPKGSTVTLTIGRTSKPPKKDAHGQPILETKELKIVRDTITVKSAKLTDKGHGIFVIQISSFNDDVAETFVSLENQALEKGATGLIIDLRNDPGGYLERAVQIAGEWMNGDIVVKQRKQGKIVETFKGEGSNRLRSVPTVVLVNEGSASAAEILAGALQDYGIAKIVGAKTFGKGSVQNVIDYPDGSSVKITISEWVTPKDRSIDKGGITPDIEVKMTSEDYNADRDPQLDKAIEILSSAH